MVTTRLRFAAALLVPLLAVLAGCGSDSEESAAPAPDLPETSVTAPPSEEPAAGGSDAEAYAKVVMTTNLSETFSGYEVDGTTIRFTTAPGQTLDDAACQYLRMSNTALRESAGLSVLVVTDGSEVAC